MKIASISSVKMGDVNEGSLKNNYLYNDKELFDDADLDWYDYGFRNYDPQIGRFTQLDPLTDDYPELTPYQYASNDPISNIDIDGLEGGSALDALSAIPTGAMAAEKSLAPVVVMGLSHAAKSSSSFFSVAGSFLKGFGKDLWGAVKGVGHAVAHLPTTLKNIADLNNPVNSAVAGLAMYHGVQNKIQEFKNGNANTKAEIIGAGAGEILQLFGGEIGEIGKVGEISKAAEISEDVGKAVEAAEKGTNVVYQGFDKTTGAVKYVGITKRSSAVRFGEHLNSGTAKSLLDYRVVPGATNMSRIDARIMEQTLINQHGLKNLLNIRNSIAPKNWSLYSIK